jgi:hypothetical protein
MNTLQIQRALRCDPDTIKYDIKVVSAEYTPPIDHELGVPYGIIVDTDTSQYSGSHWLPLWVNVNNMYELFDSLARPPAYYENAVKLISYFRETFVKVESYN